MRLAPVALRFRHDRPRLLAAAADQSRTTHGAEEAVDACRAFGELLAGRHRRVTVLGRSGSETVHGSSGNHSGHSRQLARTDTGYDPLQRVRRSHARSRHLVSRPHRRLPRRGAARGQPGRRRRYGSSSDGAARRRPLRPERHPRPLAGTRCLEGSTPGSGAALLSNPLPTGRSWVGSRSTALDPVANTDTKLLILWSVSKGRVLAQDAQNSRSTFESRGCFTERRRTASCWRRATFSRASSRRALKAETRARTNDEIMPAWCRQTGD